MKEDDIEPIGKPKNKDDAEELGLSEDFTDLMSDFLEK